MTPLSQAASAAAGIPPVAQLPAEASTLLRVGADAEAAGGKIPSQSELALAVPLGIRKVRCLSLWQPWASLMACKAKYIETRGWDTKVRGEIYIHAGATKTPIKEYLKSPGWWISLVEEALDVCADKWLTDLPYGALIGRGNLVASMPIEKAEQAFPSQVPFGDFTPGRFGHLYHKLTAIDPIPMKGKQGFFFADLP